MKTRFLLPFIFIFLFSCSDEKKASLILTNGNVLTMDSTLMNAQTIVIQDRHIIAIGGNELVDEYKNEQTKVVDLKGKFMMPGFIEGHGHFSGLGKSLINLNFLGSKNWDEIVGQVAAKVKTVKPGEWIEGRGWHQEKWDKLPAQTKEGYPFHDDLSDISPDNPVILYHASGHSVFANKKAMEMVGISEESPDPKGGAIIRDDSGKPTGVFEERAMDAFWYAHKDYQESLAAEVQEKVWTKSIALAQRECLENGITSFQDAGTTLKELTKYKALAEAGNLDVRLYGMLREKHEILKDNLDGVPIVDAGNGFFTCRAIKSEVDGALGAFGAWLLKEYHDKPGFTGQNTTPIPDVKAIAELALQKDMQLCVHAIGDRANRVTLNIYEEAFNGKNADRRWRIEHAQHLDAQDIPRFKSLNVIASMQGIHCTSDSPFVEKRLGEQRSRKGAYPWRSLLDNGVVIANGTDAPVEDVDPLSCIYASVTRKRADNGFEFFPEQRMTRMEALHSYTLGNAYAAFEEDKKGSLTVFKLADMVVLSNNLLTCPEEDILTTKVLMTIIDGKIVYEQR